MSKPLQISTRFLNDLLTKLEDIEIQLQLERFDTREEIESKLQTQMFTNSQILIKQLNTTIKQQLTIPQELPTIPQPTKFLNMLEHLDEFIDPTTLYMTCGLINQIATEIKHLITSN